jgi:hypothetical protein
MQLPNGVKSIGTIPVRNAEEAGVPDTPKLPPQQYVLITMARMHANLAKLMRAQDDNSRPVDEYQINATYNAADDTTNVEVQPQFDTCSERITGILITGPASTAFTLQLGDRSFNVLTDPEGRWHIMGTAFMLSRNDRRILTSTTNAEWTLELFGYADERF